MEHAESCLTTTLQQLEALRDEIKDRNIDRWKQRLKQSQSQRHTWLKGLDLVPTLNLVSSKLPNLPMSKTATETVAILAKHWRVVWDRPCDWRRGLANLLDSGHVPRGQQMSYQRLDHEVVKSVADKMRSKAAGADGWSGSEVADLPDDIWKFVVEIFTWLEEARSVPDTWKFSKQSHIPKTGDVTIFTFVDDRTFTSKRPDVLIDVHKLWSDWSEKLGLVENAEKPQFFHRTPAGRGNLVKSGVSSSQVTDHPKILGNEVAGSQSKACSNSEEKRIRESCKQIKRVQWMPLSFKLKKLALQMGPLAKVSWGWFFNIPDKRTLEKVQISVSASLYEAHGGFPALGHLYRSHNLHFEFLIQSKLFGAVWRYLKKSPEHRDVNWTVLDKLMLRWNWTKDSDRVSGVWKHTDLGTLNIHRSKLDLLQHQLREVFRLF